VSAGRKKKFSVQVGSTPNSDINITPLVDVVLVLLIIFMVIMPLTLRGYDLDIPGGAVSTGEPEVADEQVVLAIAAGDCPALEVPAGDGLPEGCAVRINDEPVALAGLPQRLAEIYAGRGPDARVLFLAAEERLNYEAVMRIVDLARTGVTELRIGLVTGPDRANVARSGPAGSRQPPQVVGSKVWPESTAAPWGPWLAGTVTSTEQYPVLPQLSVALTTIV